MKYDVMFVGGSFPMPMGGGSVNYIYRILSEFKGVSYVVYTSSFGAATNKDFDSSFEHPIIRSKYCYHVLGTYKRNHLKRLFDYVVEILQIVYYILKFRPKIVYFTELSLAVYSYKVANIFSSFKVGLFTYSEEIQQVQDRSIYRKLLTAVLQDADVIVTVCDYTHEMLNKIVNVDKKILKIIPPIPYEGISPIKREKEGDMALTVLTVGRLCERKGHIDVINALIRLHECHPNVKYEIVGTGEFEKIIRDHIKKTNSEDFVMMRGKLADSDLNDAYEKADIFVMHHKLLPNGDTEGCPTVFLEASWHRLPVVGGEAGGVSDAIIDGETGFICHIDTDELYEKLKVLIEDVALRREMGEKGYNYARGFTMSNQSKKFLEHTNNLLN